MTASTLLRGLLMAFLLAFCESQDNTASQTAMLEETNALTTVPTLLAQNNSESSHANVDNVGLSPSETATRFANKTQQAVTQIPLHTYLLSQSKVPETLGSSEGANTVINEVNRESRNLNAILGSEDELLASQLVTAGPTLGNSVEDIAGTMPMLTSAIYTTSTGNTCINPSEVSIFGLEGWKFGLISAAVPVFLAVEALVLAIYCTKCKKSGRKAISAKSCEDSEAAETINAESNENTITANNITLSQANNPLETSETQNFSEADKEAKNEQSQDPPDLDTNYKGKAFTT